MKVYLYVSFPQATLGRKLAEMHKVGKSEKGFGFDVDNTIGRLPLFLCLT